jgi:hypothetical protein
MDGFKRMFALFDDADRVTSSPLKHAFLPELWQEDRCPLVECVLQTQPNLPPAPDGWRSIGNSKSKDGGWWHNSVNRMITKFWGNIKVHATAGLMGAVQGYLSVAPLDPDTARSELRDVTVRRLRPIVAHNDDWEMAMALRTVLSHDGVLDDGWLPKRPRFSRDVMVLHLFLTRFGAAGRSYLPVAGRGRKYAYIDAKVAEGMFIAAEREEASKATRDAAKASRDAARAASDAAKKAAKETKLAAKANPGAAKASKKDRADAKAAADKADAEAKAAAKRARAEAAERKKTADAEARYEAGSVCVGDLLSLTPRHLNERRSKLRAQIRRRCRQITASTGAGTRRRQRMEQVRERWRRIGCAKVKNNMRIDSIETDGVGIRMVFKTPLDMTQHVGPVPLEADDEPSTSSGRRRGARQAKAQPSKTDALRIEDEAPLCATVSGNPVFAGNDEGRAKLFTVAISQDPIVKPKSEMFKRGRYYYEIRHSKRRRWELARQQEEGVKAAIVALSDGNLKSCDPRSWSAYLAAETTHRTVLDAEFVIDKERALWRMRAFRWKKASVDGAAQRLMKALTTGGDGKRLDVSRPIVLGDGAANFASGGPGEKSVPRSALVQALSRALERERERGRQIVVLKIDEFRTTMCCSACGEVTTPARVRRHVKNEEGEWEVSDAGSRRLRCCTSTKCSNSIRIRDRDVQASRNILWCTIAKFYGLDRPEYLKRPIRAQLAVPQDITG